MNDRPNERKTVRSIEHRAKWGKTTWWAKSDQTQSQHNKLLATTTWSEWEKLEKKVNIRDSHFIWRNSRKTHLTHMRLKLWCVYTDTHSHTQTHIRTKHMYHIVVSPLTTSKLISKLNEKQKHWADIKQADPTQHNTSTLPILTMIEPFFSCVTFFLPLATFYELISSSSLLLLLLMVVVVKNKRKTGWEATECNIKKMRQMSVFSPSCACFSLQKIRSSIVLKWKLFSMRYDEINMLQILMVCKFKKFLLKYMHTEQCQCSQ